MGVNCRLSHKHDRLNCVARDCEECGEREDGMTRTKGARYFVGDLWLCARCHWEAAVGDRRRGDG